MMAYIGAGSRVFAASGNLSVPVPAGVVAGDLLLAVITFPNNGISQVIGLPPEFTVLQRQAVNAFADSLGFYWGIHTTGTSYTFNISGGGASPGARIQIFAYRGVGASPIISSALNTTSPANGSSVTTSIGVATLGCKEIVYTAHLETVARTIVPDATLSLRSQSTVHPSYALADADISSGNTPVRTATGLVSGGKVSFNVLVQFSGGGGGTAPTGTVTIGTITPNSTGASAPFTYSAADQTGFEYQLNETGTIYPIAASPATPTGLTPSTGYTIRVRAKNASGEGAWSASAPFTTSAAGSPPAGTFTVGTITTTQTTASVPYTYSAADQTSIEYRIDGGATVTASASPQSLTGLTAGTTYGIQFRAVNAFGGGAWSTSAPFTTASVPVGTITIPDVVNNTDTTWASVAVDAATIMPLSLGSVVVNKTGLSTTAGADLVIADAAITTGTEYIIILKIGTAYGWYRAVAT